jgi:hypothetical protein
MSRVHLVPNQLFETVLHARSGDIAKVYVRSHSAWFHGADASEGLSFSIRVDGIFTDALRALIPDPGRNRAAAPAVWAGLILSPPNDNQEWRSPIR